MKKSIIDKLDSTAERLEEISALLSDPEIISDQERFRNPVSYTHLRAHET